MKVSVNKSIKKIKSYHPGRQFQDVCVFSFQFFYVSKHHVNTHKHAYIFRIAIILWMDF